MSELPTALQYELASNLCNAVAGASGKNDIKVSAEGVAKLTFNFLDEMQGDSSLEPGEVKTPPYNSVSPAVTQELGLPSKPKAVPGGADDAYKKAANITLKTASQLDAEVCQEKVRAILALDAIKRKEEAEKRKEQMEKRRCSGDVGKEEEQRKKAKEARKRLKKLRREQNEARLALLSDEETELEKDVKFRQKSQEYDEEGLYSNSDSSPNRGAELRCALVNAANVPIAAGGPQLSHLSYHSDTFMGFRGMNPSMRGVRPDFQNMRGGFMPRGRGCMRGGIRFPGFRPPFYINGPPRLHAPLVQRQHTPPPVRGHSPIQASDSTLSWTKTKPSISYAFNSYKDNKPKPNTAHKGDLSVDMEKFMNHSKQFRHSSSKPRPKKSHESEKVKERRSSRSSSEKSNVMKNSNELKQQILQTLPKKVATENEESIPYTVYAEKMQLGLNQIKVEKIDDHLVEKMSAPILLKTKDVKVKKEEKSFLVETAPLSEDPCDISLNIETANDRNVDMFAESPSRTNKFSSVKGTNSSAVQSAEKVSKTDKALIKSKQKSDVRKSTSERDKGATKSGLVASVSSSIIMACANDNGSTTPPPPAQKSVDKTALQKNLEIQKRIDKLLQDEDLQLENIQATKAKLLEKSKNLVRDSSCSKTREEKKRTVTPELPKHRNPFKRSVSRDLFFSRTNSKRHSRSQTRERDTMPRKTLLSKERRRHMARARSRSRECDWHSSTGSLQRSHSRDRDKLDKSKWNDLERRLSKSPNRQRANSKYKSESLERKTLKSNTPPLQKTPKLVAAMLNRDKNKVKCKVKNKEKEKWDETAKLNSHKKLTSKTIKHTPMSFTAAEFLFPEEVSDNSIIDDDDISLSKRRGVVTERARNSEEKTLKCDKEASPDTDDYMDNWENEEPDVEGNSSSANEAATPLKKAKMLKRQKKEANENFVARFANPSPPLQLLQKAKEALQELEGSTPQNSPPTKARVGSKNFSVKPSAGTVNRELFGMQDLYDQFIKSVEQSGVDLKPPTTPKPTALDYGEEQFSSSLSSSSCSSSSDGSNSSNSSSSSSTASSSGDSKYIESSHKLEISSSNLKANEQSPKSEMVAVNQKQEKEDVRNLSPKSATPISTPPTGAKPSTTPPPLILAESTPMSSPTGKSVRNVKSEAAKDFKKLRNLETNLARIQMMRATYDSADEISEELIKMEKLFLQEKTLILQKYAKSAASKVAEAESDMPTSIEASAHSREETAAQTVDSTGQLGQFVASLQETDAESGDGTINNRIFDSNREAIKLTISPLKLSMTPAIFEKNNDEDSSLKPEEEPEEADFTEKLLKPHKEVAIVKPMMESKASRSSYQSQRRSPPRSSSSSSTVHEQSNSRAEAYRDRDRDRDRGRRSVSRFRLSPQRRVCARSLSFSPPRRGNGRQVSPPRRAKNSSRYRGSGRRSRSRSRSRSISKQPRRRGGDLSPQIRRRRGAGGTSGRKGNQCRFQRDSRSHSPRSPPLRPHSPRSPPPAMSSRRRSYSRERYTRSPLPFKPPSPPMQRSLSPAENTRRCSHSMSRSRSPPSRAPRSPRSPSPLFEYLDEHRRRRADSYDSRSPSPQNHQYYSPDLEGSMPGEDFSNSSYYYNVSPNRISLDARINIVLNEPHIGQEGIGALATYENYSYYGQYGGAAYMPMPPHPGSTHEASVNPYYANQYVPMFNSDQTQSLHSQQPMYSNIPTIGGSGAAVTAVSNIYYNEFGNHPGVAADPRTNSNFHQPNSLLKELPKAMVAVQKGNVLEIVPSSEIPSSVSVSEIVAIATKKKKKKRVTVSWKEEVNKRQLKVEVLKLSRGGDDNGDGAARSILKKSDVPEASKVEINSEKKKVYFEDGIFPNRDSDYEDRLQVEDKFRRKVRKLRKRTGESLVIPVDVLVTGDDSGDEEENNISIDFEKLPPPPPPPGKPPPHLEQPIYRGPRTPKPPLYFHFDPVVQSMYFSHLERAIPPRLLNLKSVSNSGSGASGVAESPSNNQSPTGDELPATTADSSEIELTTTVALERSNCASEQSSPSSPELIPSLPLTVQQADLPPHSHLQSLSPPDTSPTTHNTDSEVSGADADDAGVTAVPASPVMTRGTFQEIPATATESLSSPQMATPDLPVRSPRPAAPINDMSCLPSSQLDRPILPTPAPVFTTPQQNAIPVVGMRHHQPLLSPPHHLLYHMATPTTIVSGLPSIPSPTVNEFDHPHPHLLQHQNPITHLQQPQHQQYPFSSGPLPSSHHYHAPPQDRTSPQHCEPPPAYFLPSPQAVRNISPLVEICPTATSTTPPRTAVSPNTAPSPQVMASGGTDVLTTAVSPQPTVEPFKEQSS